MEINEDFVPATRKCIEIEDLDYGCILYDTEKNEAHSLNISAASVWTCCDGKHSRKEIAAIVKECFKPKSKSTMEDIIKIVKVFSQKELLRS